MIDAPVGSKLFRFARMICRITATVFFDLRVSGIKHVPRGGGVLLVANHQSYLDPVVLGVQIKRPLSFFARSELFSNRWFGALLRGLNAFPVRQGEGDVAAVREAIARLQRGDALAIFPEGGRSEDGNLQPMQPGVALIVRRAGVPIVPVMIQGTFVAWSKWRLIFRPAKVRVRYGPPLRVAGLKSHEIVHLIDATLREMEHDMRSIC